MDAIEILGELLGRKKSPRSGGATSGGPGEVSIGDVLFGGNRRQGAESGPMGKDEIRDMASELEDLLNVGKNSRGSGQSTGNSRTGTVQSPPRAPSPPARPGFPPAQRDERSTRLNPPKSTSTRDYGTPDWKPRSSRPEPAFEPDGQAALMIRAILNAAKSDGEISSDEQQRILKSIGERSPEAIEFLNREIAEPLNVRDFAWSVPIGMEQQVYTLSAVSIRLDTEHEADYLVQLAHGLRIPRETLHEIHEHYRIPQLPDQE
jgi:Protein of unknown function (DUF533)